MTNYTFSADQAIEAAAILSRVIEEVSKDDEYRIIHSTLKSAEAVAASGSNMVQLILTGNQLRWVRDIIGRVNISPDYVRVFNDVLGTVTIPTPEYISAEEYRKEWFEGVEGTSPTSDETHAVVRKLLKHRQEQRLKIEATIEQLESEVASLRLEARRKLYEAKNLKLKLN